MSELTRSKMRALTIARSFFEPTDLKSALDRLAFVQADPIRSPARAQDLILRQRVEGYLAGDLERMYPSLEVEEDFLYAYGFLPRAAAALLHPKSRKPLSQREKTVLTAVRELGPTHPRNLADSLGKKRIINAWGGHSNESTRILDTLHMRGFLRVVRRENGIRVYESCRAQRELVEPDCRFRELLKLIINLLGPTSERTLSTAMTSIRRSISNANFSDVVPALIEDGELARQSIDGVSYLFTPGTGFDVEVPRRVRILAPFDPLVWDRSRVEHFWGWKYRFEAYTPKAKRIRGYYAMPLLWMDRLIGWVNVHQLDRRLEFDSGFIGKAPREKDFHVEFESEVDRMKTFLNLPLPITTRR